MRLLVTGSSGFIASYFINRYDVKYSIDFFSFLNDDFKKLNLVNFDSVLHFSALVHQTSVSSEEEYEKINVVQTLELAKKARESGVGHFIFMSTVKVYGEETELIYSEESECFPQGYYAKSKLKAERELQKLQSNNFKVSIIRTPIVYGRHVKANMKNLINLVSKFPVLPFGDIHNRRSMVYIGNLCHLIDTVIIKKRSGVFLASDNQALSTSRLIELIAQNLDKKIYLIKIPFFASFLKFIKPSIYKRLYKSLEINSEMTKKTLELENMYSIEEGIKFMITGEDK